MELPITYLSGCGNFQASQKGGIKMDKKWVILLIILSLTGIVFLSGCVSQQPTSVPTPTVTVQPTAAPKLYSQAEADALMQWRELWTDHAVWTRMYIIESLDDSPGTNAAAARLLKNQEDIGNAMKPYYGDAAGTKLTALLKNHITIAVAIINDVKARNITAQAADEARWTSNADEIAAFLTSANPNWRSQDAKDMMHMHLSTTKAELVARYTKDYPADVKAWDAVYNHVMKMSDTVSVGIIAQYPEKFAGPKVYSQKEIDLRNNMRQLWTDHTVWTRLYIIESLNNSPASGEAATRLLKNQEDIGNAIKPIYGDAAGTKLTGLLKVHILTAVAIINDVKAKNTSAQAIDEAMWTRNGDDIAGFLAGANPNWPLPVLTDMMHMHLSTTKDELVARYTRDYPADVKAWDVVYDHILKMSDALADGIAKQFPTKF
jgi:hypothetical protein